MPALVGTVLLTLGTAIAAIPLGVGAAIYLAEYARDTRLTRMIRLAIVNLAGIPSIGYGLFGLGVVVLFLDMGTSIIAGSLTLGIMTLPVVISTSEEAILAVPQEFRLVSLSLGATRWQTIRNQVMPQALPGIITGVILGLGRAAGETAPILFTVAAFYLPELPKSIFDQTMALPYHLYVIATQVPGMPLSIQYGTALVLLFLAAVAHHGVRVGRATYLVDMADADNRAQLTAVSNTVMGVFLLAGGGLGLVDARFGTQAVLGLLGVVAVAAVLRCLALPRVD